MGSGNIFGPGGGAGSSPLTTKGDIYTTTGGADARLAVGTNGHALIADSGETTGLRWAALPTSALEASNLSLAASVSANALTISLKNAAGNDPTAAAPVLIGFRSSTLTSGAYNQRSVTGALSVTVSSGSTLGHVNGQPSDIYVYAIDNSGTVELAVSSTRYGETAGLNTSAEGGAGGADSRSTVYSTAARTGVPSRLIGVIRSSQTTAGTWASAPTRITVVGVSSIFTVPSVQRFTSGTGTYITPAGVTFLRVRMVGGGGGGGSSGTASFGAPTAAGDTTFGDWTARAGTGGSQSGIATGGTVTNGTGTVLVSLSGTSGGGGSFNGAAGGAWLVGGSGGESPLTGAGKAAYGAAGTSAIANSGSGGGGGSTNATINSYSGSGGGAGGYAEFIITNPAGSYSYGVGAGGSGGSAGTNGFAGGNGGSGIIIVEEYYV